MSRLPPFLRRGLPLNPALFAGLVLLAAVLALLGASCTVLDADPMAIVARPFLEPGENPRFPLGTDMLGRDMLTAVAHGTRVSLLVGLSSTAFALALGLTAGIAGGYFGGVVDLVATRVTELFQALPALLLAIVLVAVLTPSIWSVILAIGLTSWTQIARVVRPEVLRLKQADFVHAAAIGGMGHAGIILHEILPNVLSTVWVLTSILIAGAILTEAALSFLGLGDPNLMSWGALIGAGRTVLRDAWHVSALPGIATLVTVLAFTLIGNGLNDALNRRSTQGERAPA
ncbi:ABC transporter permease [Xanthobacter sediminis]